MRRLITLCLVALTAACGDSVPDPDGAPALPPRLDALEGGLVLPGSVLSFVGDGFLSPPAGETQIQISGQLHGAGDPQPLQITLRPREISGAALRVPIDLDALVDAGFPAEGGRFVGEARAQVTAADRVTQGGDAALTSAPAPLTFELRPSLAPRLERVSPTTVHPGAALQIQGDGLISEGEGSSYLSLTGRFDDDAGGGWDLQESRLPLLDRAGRREGAFYLRPSLLSLAPGWFTGEAQLVTVDAEGERQTSAALAIQLRQDLPTILDLSPRSVSRGQILTLRGAGFLPNDPRAATATLITASGRFEYDDGRPPLELTDGAAFHLIPEQWLDNREIRIALRTQRHPETGALVGLGANPGVFTGDLVVSLFSGLDQLDTAAIPATLRVAPMTQVVWLNYRPGFSEGLALFGLRAAEVEIRQRILEVCQRDFSGLRVEFTEARPTGWTEYVTVDIGGRDPNALGLFGLDNTLEKDTGNLVLSEHIGGLNGETAAAGIVAYGGIFVESLLTLSPRHEAPAVIASPRFDDLFGPFSPTLGGAPVARAEISEGVRQAVALEAARALGNLVGTTITHEVGHTLGLASVDGDVHNPVDTDGGLMDRGEHRPFEERAELDGQGPSRFLGANRAYLLSLLGEAP